jgi:hypothetical protein
MPDAPERPKGVESGPPAFRCPDGKPDIRRRAEFDPDQAGCLRPKRSVYTDFLSIYVIGTTANTATAPQQTMPTSQANDRITGILSQ